MLGGFEGLYGLHESRGVEAPLALPLSETVPFLHCIVLPTFFVLPAAVVMQPVDEVRKVKPSDFADSIVLCE